MGARVPYLELEHGELRAGVRSRAVYCAVLQCIVLGAARVARGCEPSGHDGRVAECHALKSARLLECVSEYRDLSSRISDLFARVLCRASRRTRQHAAAEAALLLDPAAAAAYSDFRAHSVVL